MTGLQHAGEGWVSPVDDSKSAEPTLETLISLNEQPIEVIEDQLRKMF